MSGKIETLKYAIFSEWASYPAAGDYSSYSDVYGESYEDLIEAISESYNELIESLEPEDADELNAAYDKVRPDKESILSYSWNNGGIGVECLFVAEGKEIASAAAEFYQTHLADDTDDGDDDEDEDYEEESDEDEKQRILQDAVDNPDDYDAVIRLLDMISEAIEDHNGSTW